MTDFCTANRFISNYVSSGSSFKNIDAVTVEANTLCCETLTVAGQNWTTTLNDITTATTGQTRSTNPARTEFADGLYSTKVEGDQGVFYNLESNYMMVPADYQGNNSFTFYNLSDQTATLTVNTTENSMWLDAGARTAGSSWEAFQVINGNTGNSTIRMGYSSSTSGSYTSGYFTFKYSGSGNTANCLELGLASGNNQLQIYGGADEGVMVKGYLTATASTSASNIQNVPVALWRYEDRVATSPLRFTVSKYARDFTITVHAANTGGGTNNFIDYLTVAATNTSGTVATITYVGKTFGGQTTGAGLTWTTTGIPLRRDSNASNNSYTVRLTRCAATGASTTTRFLVSGHGWTEGVSTVGYPAHFYGYINLSGSSYFYLTNIYITPNTGTYVQTSSHIVYS